MLFFFATLDIINLLLMLIIWNCTKVDGFETCKSTKLEDGQGITLHWSETPLGELRPSSPMCIDNDDNVLERRCMENGFWEEFEPQRCAFYALNKFSSCPYGMKRVRIGDRSMCLTVTTPMKWNNSCLNYGSTKSVLDLSSENFQDLVDYLKNVEKLDEFWLPVKRYQDYNPFQWQLVGKRWGETVHFDCYDFEIKDNYKNDCLKIEINGTKQTLKSENCEKEIPEVCLYEEKSALKLACENGLTSRYAYHQNKCFSVDKSGKLASKTIFKASSLYSKMFLKDLMYSFDLEKDDHCVVDFGKSQSYFTNSSYGNYTVMNLSLIHI